MQEQAVQAKIRNWGPNSNKTSTLDPCQSVSREEVSSPHVFRCSQSTQQRQCVATAVKDTMTASHSVAGRLPHIRILKMHEAAIFHWAAHWWKITGARADVQQPDQLLTQHVETCMIKSNRNVQQSSKRKDETDLYNEVLKLRSTKHPKRMEKPEQLSGNICY